MIIQIARAALPLLFMGAGIYAVYAIIVTINEVFE